MYTLNENDRQYRHGDHGPKYLEKGPRMNFGIVRLLPRGTVSAHMHTYMQESFFVLEGSPVFITDKTETQLHPGDYLHIEPGEAHKIENRNDTPVRMIVTAAPFMENDKTAVEM